MKYTKKLKSIILSLSLLLLSASAFANTINAEYDAENAASLFILEALFSNTENPYPVELWGNRENEKINIFDIAREIKSIAKLKDKVFSNTEESKRAILFARLSQMEDIADRALVMESDQWKSNYVNELMKHIIGIRHAGISALIPSALDPSTCKNENIEESTPSLRESKNLNIINPCDENGRPWTSQARLAEPNEAGLSIANYMQQQKTDIQLVKNWWDSQLAGSWWAGCSAVKFFYSNQRTVDLQSYYWEGKGYEAAKNEYSSFWENGAFIDNDCSYLQTNKEKEYATAFTIWHAYVQEVLAKTKFYHNNPKDKKICAIRTISANALKRNNITRFGKGYIMPNAAYDSCSLINIFAPSAPKKAIIELSVPHHRIIHLYPLLVPNPSISPEDVKELEKDVDFLKNYYDENGSLTVDKTNPSSVQKLIEEYLYHIYIKMENELIENIFKNDAIVFTNNFENYEHFVIGQISALPEQLPADKITETLLNILIEGTGQEVEKSSTYFHETEVIVLSGPDLPFDYFYNTNDDLSSLEKRLNNGEGACGYWPELKELIQIGPLGKSTFLYQNKRTGKKYVLKKGASDDLVRKEALADILYGAMGHAVPESRLYGSPEGPVKVAVYLENSKSLGNVYSNADDAEKQRLRHEISKGFVVDALIANFNVIGPNMDKILIGEDGQTYRVDNSESYEEWSASPIVLWTLRDSEKKPNCTEIFKDLTIYEIAENIKSPSITTPGITEYAYDEKTKTLKTTVMPDAFAYQHILANHPELETQINKRHESFIKVANNALEMKTNGFSSEKADIELRRWVEAQDWDSVSSF